MIDKRLSLPNKHYGPLCIKIMEEFASHHKVSLLNYDLPCKDDISVDILSKIMHLMVCTFDESKKREIIEEIETYKEQYEKFFSNVSGSEKIKSNLP